MLPVYNEEEMVEEVIQHLISQEFEMVVLDNGSTDGSYEKCKKFAERGLITLKQVETKNFDWTLILRILYDMALTKNPDWLIRSDQDEFLESGQSNLSLKEAIEKENERGNNLIQFNVFEFFQTNNDNLTEKSIKAKFSYYSWQHDRAYRAWKHVPGTRVEYVGGHMPIFPDGCKYKIAERNFILRHYRFRSYEQAIKNHEQRLERTKNLPERKIGWHDQIHKISQTKFYDPVNSELLNKYNEDNYWNCEQKFRPFVMTNHKTRNQIFSKDGNMIKHHLTLPEMWEELERRNEKIQELKKDLENNNTEKLNKN